MILNSFPQDPPTLTVVQQSGIAITLSDGRRLLDLTGGGTSYCNVGWAHPEVIEALTNSHKSGGHSDIKLYIDQRREELANLLVGNSGLKFKGVFFSGHSGADACEAAMKLSFQGHARRSESRTKFIFRQGSYHGASAETAAISDRINLRELDPLLRKDNKIIVSQHSVFDAWAKGITEQEYLDQTIAEVKNVIEQNDPSSIAAFVAETCTGGLQGFQPPVPGYWRRMKGLLDEYGIHLIIDEIIVGLGVTGRYHAIEYDDAVTPDFLCCSKGLTCGYAPLSAVLIRDKVFNELIQEPRIHHTQTFQGHGPAVAAAIAVQKIVSRQEVLEQVRINFEAVKHLVSNELLSKSKRALYFSGRGHRYSISYGGERADHFGRKLTKLLAEKDGIVIDGKWGRISFSPSMLVNSTELLDLMTVVCKRFLELERNNG